MLPGGDEWLAAFWELSTDRSFAGAVSPIPSRSIREWSRDYPDRDEFLTAIRRMDAVVISHFEAKQDKADSGGGAEAPQPITADSFMRAFGGRK